MIAIVAAYSENYVIGNQGKIPWSIDGEQKRFKELTTGNVVIMGRRTFVEIGRPLPNRFTILVSSTMEYESDNCITVTSLGYAIEIATKLNKHVYISGGVEIYKEALDMHIVDKMYITIVHKKYEGDVFFPKFDEKIFVKTFSEDHFGEIAYTYMTYEKKQ